MTSGSFLGILGMLGLVLGLLLLTLKLLRRFVPLAGNSGSQVPLAIVQRLALGPRQGIAVVRIGDQVLAVSVGDGGVRLIAQIETADDPSVVPASDTASTAGAPMATTFHRLLGSALRLPLVIALLLAAAASGVRAQGAVPPTAGAAQAPSRPATSPAQVPTKPAPSAARAVAPPPRPPIARVDTMLSRLAPRLDLRVGNEQAGGLRLSGTVGIVVMMGLLTLLPMLVLMMTGFTRILIVLHFLRQAIGAQSAPPAQLVAGLALLLTGFVMAPTLTEVNRTALEPWMDGRMEQAQMLAEGVKPFRSFMLRQTREHDLTTFMNLSRLAPVAGPEDVPLVVLLSAFVTSELRVAFQMGFALFLPFIVIDIVVASVLMSMGMMMLPPAMISLPFKLLLFVLVDGWSLVTQGLVQSFR
ncbi:MAG: flagellar type III secretion system pore protein FliP [Gemmatimonadaceae bacterium]